MSQRFAEKLSVRTVHPTQWDGVELGERRGDLRLARVAGVEEPALRGGLRVEAERVLGEGGWPGLYHGGRAQREAPPASHGQPEGGGNLQRHSLKLKP